MHSPNIPSDYYLPQGYIPNHADILCGRGKAHVKHRGNITFMGIIRSSLKNYTDSKSRIEKSIVVSSVVSDIIDSGMRFIKVDTDYNRYVELSLESAHEKVGHAIRDLLKQERKNNKKNIGTTKATSDMSKNLYENCQGSMVGKVHRVSDTFVVDNTLFPVVAGSKQEVTKGGGTRKNPMSFSSSHFSAPNNTTFMMQQAHYQQQGIAKNKLFSFAEYANVFDDGTAAVASPGSIEEEGKNLQAVLSALSGCDTPSRWGGENGRDELEDLLLKNIADEDIFSTDPLDDRIDVDGATRSIHHREQKPLHQANRVTGAAGTWRPRSLDANLDFNFPNFEGLSNDVGSSAGGV